MPTVATGADTRVRVLTAALELIAEKGYAATSTREVSERLGFTKAALYYHFRTKEDLLFALVEPGLIRLRELVDQPSGAGDEGRRALLAGYIDMFIDNIGLARVLSQDPAVSRSERLTRITGPLYERFISRLLDTGRPTSADLARAHVALGGIHAALLNHTRDAAISDVRAGTLAAACGALGLGQPRA